MLGQELQEQTASSLVWLGSVQLLAVRPIGHEGQLPQRQCRCQAWP